MTSCLIHMLHVRSTLRNKRDKFHASHSTGSTRSESHNSQCILLGMSVSLIPRRNAHVKSDRKYRWILWRPINKETGRIRKTMGPCIHRALNEESIASQEMMMNCIFERTAKNVWTLLIQCGVFEYCFAKFKYTVHCHRADKSIVSAMTMNCVIIVTRFSP